MIDCDNIIWCQILFVILELLLHLVDREHRRSFSAKPEKVLVRPRYRGGQRRPGDEARFRQRCQEHPLLEPPRVLARLVQL